MADGAEERVGGGDKDKTRKRDQSKKTKVRDKQGEQVPGVQEQQAVVEEDKSKASAKDEGRKEAMREENRNHKIPLKVQCVMCVSGCLCFSVCGSANEIVR